ncbi:MAG: cobalt transporter CbiM [Nitrospirota bacterium]
MHIPDGYLSPQTFVPLYAVSAGFWTVGLRKLKRELTVKQVPYLSMAAAFSFLIMMFNIPIPGGTSGHAVGGGIIAILLGPWTAVIAVSVVLMIQALVFGDGGITAFGANCFNMAIVAPFVSWWIFRLVAGRQKKGFRLMSGAFLSGWLGLSVASAFAGFEFGIQPVIAHGPGGAPLYAPYPMSVALPAMFFGHLLVFGPFEGIVTMLLVKYFYSTDPVLVAASDKAGHNWRWKPWLALIVLAALTPLGIIIPAKLNGKDAWGEWGPGKLKELIGYVPAGLQRLHNLWNPPMPNYGSGAGASASGAGGYLASGFTGAVLAVGLIYLLTRLLKPKSSRLSYLDKGLSHIAKVTRNSYVQWELSSRKGFFQELDARVKVIFMLLMLVAVNIRKDLPTELIIAAFIFALALASKVGLKVMYGRVVFIGFFFGFLVALPSSLNIITPGKPILTLFHLHEAHSVWTYKIPKEVGLTAGGLFGVAMLTTRVINSVSLAMLVLFTTPFTEIMRALKTFRVPDSVLAVVNLTYKYIFIFAKTVEDMHLAKLSRTAGTLDGSEARRWAAGRMGVIFKKTQTRCDEIFKAMLSRGFTGEMKLRGQGSMKKSDWLALLAAGAAGIILIFV